MRIALVDKEDINRGTYRILIHNLQKWITELGHDCIIYHDIKSYNADVTIIGKKFTKNIDEIKNKNNASLVSFINSSILPPEEMSKLDFGIAASLEEKEYCERYLNNVYRIPLIETCFDQIKQHKNSSPIVLGYHGNRHHLHEFEPDLKNAIEELSKKHNIKLKLIYPTSQHDDWRVGRPNVDIEFVQWVYDSWQDHMLECDIGLVPSVINPGPKIKQKLHTMLKQDFFSLEDDFCMKFKKTTNAGRAYVFFELGIPVVADLTISHAEIIDDKKYGFLAYDKRTWLRHLDNLCSDYELRKSIGLAARDKYKNKFCPLYWTNQMISSLRSQNG